MGLAAGTRLGPYEVVAQIGVGGMGEVYRALDTNLKRAVAIKVLPEAVAADVDRLARFQREAEVLASLNHPNIAIVHGLEKGGGATALVMELVEGPTLADRIAEGPYPLDEVLLVAKQIAEALEAAHEQGIVHRDLKPANIKVRPDGVVKVLDFGLAKASGSPVPSFDQSPTVTVPRTEAGMILGTAAYMAPEQAKGQQVDKRADIWAFGCVFYEMLTGTPIHQGDTSQETLASILRDEPDLSKVPAQARRLLKRCLEKDPQKRLRHIGDVMSLLDEPPSSQISAIRGAPHNSAQKKWLRPAVAAGIVIVSAAALFVWAPWRTQQSALHAVRFEVQPTENMRFTVGGSMTVSPDGHWMVFPATGDDGVTKYWVRSLDTVEARALPGTETVALPPPADWSYDSRYVIFTVNNKLKKVDIQGGPPQTIADLPTFQNGVTVNRDGVMIIGLSNAGGGGPLLRLPAAGGTPTPITIEAQGRARHRFPQFLPDGRHFLYLNVSDDPNEMGVYVASIDAKPEVQSQKRLLASNRQAYYAPAPNGGSGHLVFLREATLMAQPFDPVRLELKGEPVPIAEGVDSFAAANYGLFSVSDTGTIAYRSSAATKLVLTWFDQNGNPTGTVGEPAEYSSPAVSPDGTRVATAIGPVGLRDIWILDVARGTSTRLTFDPRNDDAPVWSPDGKNIVFVSEREQPAKLYIKPVDGSSEERLLTVGPAVFATSWSRDGSYLLFQTLSAQTFVDIWALPSPERASAERKPISVLATPFVESRAQFSPDGRWIAYMSQESGLPQIYVRPFPPDGSVGAGGPKWLISSGPGLSPRWSPEGRQLFYVSQNLQMMAVEIDTRTGVLAGKPHRLFGLPLTALSGPSGPNVEWDLAPDGRRFLFAVVPGGTRAVPFTVLVNWQEELKQRVLTR
jgi:Tol biopolymer transport system component